MKKKQWLCLPVLLFLNGCNEDINPLLDIDGTWNVDYGFISECTVNATFSEKNINMTFIEAVPGACFTDDLPVKNGSWVWPIEERWDYTNKEGAQAVDLQAYDPTTMITAKVTLLKTETGLLGSIADYTDPMDIVPLLFTPEQVNTLFPLTLITSSQ